MALIPDDVRAFAKAIAQANHHPDPDDWAESVVDHFGGAVPPAPAETETPQTPAA